jgi:2-phospho-L-lactate/phosphoenolpyruvate guanylyltransferase
MRALLLPVKDLRNSKQRLIGILSPQERFELAQAMLADAFRAVSNVQRAEKIFVVTNYAPAMQTARENGWQILAEDQQISESASVDCASRQCETLGITSLLRLPLDLPRVQASDIDELLAIDCPAPGMVIVPSRDGTGTNAVLRTPPTLFPSRFGPGSFAKHCAEAECRGAQIIIRRNPRLEMDIDDDSDLRTLLHHDLSATATGAFLHRAGLLNRLQNQSSTANPRSYLSASPGEA